MNFGEAIKSGFNNYVTFSGRACRSEFWYWTLFAILVTIAAGIIDRELVDSDTGLAQPLVSLALFLPGIAVAYQNGIDRAVGHADHGAGAAIASSDFFQY